jgi:hypothetical protein
MRAFLSISQEDESCCEIHKQASNNFKKNGNTKRNIAKKHGNLVNTGFREISSRENQ